MATLKKPYCSNLPCIWFEDLQPPPFVPIIISLHFVFHTMEAIRDPTYWKCLNVVRIDGWQDAASPALYQHWKMSFGVPCLRKPPMPYRSTRKGRQRGKHLEIPPAVVLGRILFQKEKNPQYFFSYLFKIWLEIFYNWEQSTGSLEAVNIHGACLTKVKRSLYKMISAGFHNTYRPVGWDSYCDVRHKLIK